MATKEEKRGGVQKWAIATLWSPSQFQLSIKTVQKMHAMTRSETGLVHPIIWDLISQMTKRKRTSLSAGTPASA